MSALIFAHPFIVAVIVAFPFRSATIHANIFREPTISPLHASSAASHTVPTIDPDNTPLPERFASIEVIRFTFASSVLDPVRLDSIFIPLDKALCKLPLHVISVYVASHPPFCAKTYEYCPSVQRGILDFLSNSDSLIKRPLVFLTKLLLSAIAEPQKKYQGVW